MSDEVLDMSEPEIWKEVPGFEWRYRVSNRGRVFSSFKQEDKVFDDSWIYYSVTCFKNGKSKKFMVHRLVAELFCEKREGCEIVNHKDGNKHNNFASNLEWVTASENMRHAYDTGLIPRLQGEKSKNNKLTEKEVLEIIELSHRGVPQSVVGKLYDVCGQTISMVLTGKHWKYMQPYIRRNELNTPCKKTKIRDQYGVVYESLTEAAEILDLSLGNLSMVLNGRRPHTRGYTFELVKENEK